MNSHINPDYSLYLVTDSGMTGREHLIETVAQAVDGGVTMVQYRDKEGPTDLMIREAKALHDLLHTRNIPLIINDRLDVALAVRADGVHLGHNDMDPVTARKLTGADAIIGYSVETWEDVRKAEQLDVDYLGVSPVFATPTKTDTGSPWGIEGLRKLRNATRKPLVAIGGLNKSNIVEVIKAGADGVAVVSAICASRTPRNSAGELADIIKQASAANTNSHHTPGC